MKERKRKKSSSYKSKGNSNKNRNVRTTSSQLGSNTRQPKRDPYLSHLVKFVDEPKEDVSKRLAKEKELQLARISQATQSSNILAKDICASEFFVADRMIMHEKSKCTLKLPAIRRTDKDVLERIERKFSIVQVYQGGVKTNRFVFSPASDLHVLLGQIEEVKKSYLYKIYRIDKAQEEAEKEAEKYPQNGEFDLPWRYVKFREGSMTLMHPNPSRRGSHTPFPIRDNSIHSAFESIKSYIEKKCPLLHVHAQDGVINGVDNFESFYRMIPQLVQHSDFTEDNLRKTDIRPRVGASYTIDEFRKNRFTAKSAYLSLLAKKHLDGYRIHYVMEHRVHSSQNFTEEEYGFIFVVKETSSTLTLIYENISDESRSSYIIKVRRSMSAKAISYLAKFLASDIENKREKIWKRILVPDDASIISLHRISHSNLNEWRDKIMEICM